MRCSCKACGTYMIQANDLNLGCRCPNCGERCTACLGTDTLISKENLKNLEQNPRFKDLFSDDFDAHSG